jgi:hypothetical protein
MKAIMIDNTIYSRKDINSNPYLTKYQRDFMLAQLTREVERPVQRELTYEYDTYTLDLSKKRCWETMEEFKLRMLRENKVKVTKSVEKVKEVDRLVTVSSRFEDGTVISDWYYTKF